MPPKVLSSECPSSLIFPSHGHTNTGPSNGYDKVINILVDPRAQLFVVHERLLKQASHYFQAALDGDWAEAKTKEFRLREENADAFRLFVYYLYHNQISYTRHDDAELFLVEAYLLGERRQAVKFKNAVIDALSNFWRNDDMRLPSLKAIMLCYNESLPDSRLRRFI